MAFSTREELEGRFKYRLGDKVYFFRLNWGTEEKTCGECHRHYKDSPIIKSIDIAYGQIKGINGDFREHQFLEGSDSIYYCVETEDCNYSLHSVPQKDLFTTKQALLRHIAKTYPDVKLNVFGFGD